MSHLPPQPEPVTESPELHPGGVDAIEDDGGAPMPRDLNPDDNAATADDDVPEEITEPDEEKKQAPDGDEDKTEPPA